MQTLPPRKSAEQRGQKSGIAINVPVALRGGFPAPMPEHSGFGSLFGRIRLAITGDVTLLHHYLVGVILEAAFLMLPAVTPEHKRARVQRRHSAERRCEETPCLPAVLVKHLPHPPVIEALQDDEVDTIAGYIMKHLGRTARVGDTIATPYGTIRVENMAQVRITQVAITPSPTPVLEA